MSKIKATNRILSLFMAFTMMATVSGCGKVDEQIEENENDTIAREIVNYYSPRTISLTDGVVIAENIKYANGNIYFSGYEPNSPAKDQMKILNLDNNSFENIDLSMIDSDCINKVLMTNEKLYITYNDYDNNTKLCVIDRVTDKLLKDTEIGNDSYINSMFINKSGNMCSLSISYASLEPVTMCSVYNEDLEISESVNISEKVDIGDEESIYHVISGENGTYYFLTTNYSSNDVKITLYKLSSSFEIEFKTEEISDMGEYISNMFINSSGNVCVAGSNYFYGESIINEFDSEDGSVLNRYELEEGTEVSPSKILGEGAAADFDFVFMDDEGINGYSFKDCKKTNIARYGDELSEEYINCYIASVCGNEIIMYARQNESINNYIYIMNTDGEIKQTIRMPQSGYNDNFGITGNGFIFYLEYNQYNIEDEEGVYTSDKSYTLHILDDKGTEKKKIELGDFGLNTYNSNVQDMWVTDDGRVYLGIQVSNDDLSNKSVFVVLDADGNKQSTITDENISSISNVIFTEEGDYLNYQSSENNIFAEIDYKNEKLGDKLKLNSLENEVIRRVYPGDKKYDFYFFTNDAVYGGSIKNDTITEIINWVDSDIEIMPEEICLIDENTILCMSLDDESSNTIMGEMSSNSNIQMINILERVEEEKLKKIQSKEIITVAGVNVMNADFADVIRQFNKNNKKYRLQINDYGKYSVYEDEIYISGANKMNADIVEGKIPDIIIGGPDVDMDFFTSNGVFTDLNKFIDSDSKIKRKDYLENIFDICSNDGKLYQIVTSFSISSLIGKASVVGKKPGWTFEEFFKFVDSKSEQNIFYLTSHSKLLKTFVMDNLSEFVDFNGKTCNFNNENFIKLLEFIKTNGIDDLNNAYETGMYTDNTEYGIAEAGYQDYNRRFYDDKCSLEQMNINGFDIYNTMQTLIVQEEITPIGIPASEGNGALINSDNSIGISEKSDKKEAAWEFVREMLLEDFQDEIGIVGNSRSFPVKKTSFDNLTNIAQRTDYESEAYYEDFEGNQIHVKPIGTEMTEKILDLARNASRTVVSDSHLTDIIKEQTDIFFCDGQSAQEAAEAIQNKALLYLNGKS